MPETSAQSVSSGLSRRNLMLSAAALGGAGGLTVAGAGAATAVERKLKTDVSLAIASTTQVATTTAVTGSGSAKWNGHQPGKIYFGTVCKGDMSGSMRRAGGAFGANRTFYKWSEFNREARNIRADHNANRLPWVSFKPPTRVLGIWKRIASGAFDADIRARARHYAQFAKPVMVTFNHEPQTDVPALGTGEEFAAAWCRIHDVMKAETGLKNIVSTPIIGEWVFSPINRKHDPEQFATRALMNRCDVFGIDVYQTKTNETYGDRVVRVLDYLDSNGHSDKMLGIGETGAANGVGTMSSDTWWTKSWNWAANNTNRLSVVCYFDLVAPDGLDGYWPIDETWAKQKAIRASRGSDISCYL
ncbi:MAG: hypothetical protein ACK5MT_09175 [Actinomycetales bacterium]